MRQHNLSKVAVEKGEVMKKACVFFLVISLVIFLCACSEPIEETYEYQEGYYVGYEEAEEYYLKDIEFYEDELEHYEDLLQERDSIIEDYKPYAVRVIKGDPYFHTLYFGYCCPGWEDEVTWTIYTAKQAKSMGYKPCAECYGEGA